MAEREKPYYVFRHCVTGCNEYRFYKGPAVLGRAAAYLTGRNFPVYLEGSGQVLRSGMDPEMTIFPGCFREILSTDGKGLYARVVYRDSGWHSLETGFGTYEVMHQGEEYRFFRGKTLVAQMRGVTGEPPGALITEDAWQWRMAMAASEPLPDGLALLLLSFPLLQIAL